MLYRLKFITRHHITVKNIFNSFKNSYFCYGCPSWSCPSRPQWLAPHWPPQLRALTWSPRAWDLSSEGSGNTRLRLSLWAPCLPERNRIIRPFTYWWNSNVVLNSAFRKWCTNFCSRIYINKNQSLRNESQDVWGFRQKMDQKHPKISLNRQCLKIETIFKTTFSFCRDVLSRIVARSQ